MKTNVTVGMVVSMVLLSLSWSAQAGAQVVTVPVRAVAVGIALDRTPGDSAPQTATARKDTKTGAPGRGGPKTRLKYRTVRMDALQSNGRSKRADTLGAPIKEEAAAPSRQALAWAQQKAKVLAAGLSQAEIPVYQAYASGQKSFELLTHERWHAGGTRIPTMVPAGDGVAPSHEPRKVFYAPERAARMLKGIYEQNDGLYYRTAGGEQVLLDLERHQGPIRAMLKSGAVGLYSKRRTEPDGEGGTAVWHDYYLEILPGGALERNRRPLATLIRKSKEQWDALDKGLDRFHDVIHAARLNWDPSRAEIAKIKAEVRAALPRVEKLIRDSDAAHARWLRDAGVFHGPFIKAVIDAADPAKLDSYKRGDHLKWANAVLAIDPLIFGRPEVMYVDPGDDIRIGVDVAKVIGNGGTMVGYEQRLKALLGEALKKTGNPVELQVEMLFGTRELGNAIDAVSEVVLRKILAPAIEWKNIKSGATSGWDNYPDGWFSIRVRPGTVKAARAALPRIKRTLARYGYRSFAKNVYIVGEDEQGNLTGEPKATSGTAFTWDWN